MTDPATERRRRRAVRLAQLLLVLAALGLWVASRLPWVQIETFDGLGQPKTTTLSGGMWSVMLLPVALLLVAAAVAALAVRGWPLRLLAVLTALASGAAGYLAISQWVVPDVSVRAADLADIPVMYLVGSERHYVGAVVTLIAAVGALAAAALLMRGAPGARATDSRYAAPGARRAAARQDESAADDASERVLWDALDEGHDPTVEPPPAQPGPDGPGEGR